MSQCITIVGILVVWKVRAKGYVAKCSAATVIGNVELQKYSAQFAGGPMGRQRVFDLSWRK